MSGILDFTAEIADISRRYPEPEGVSSRIRDEIERPSGPVQPAQDVFPAAESLPDDPGPFIDWQTFFLGEHDEASWVFPDVLARGRGHVVYAGHKLGKSLFTLWIAASLATGDEPTVVVYLDWEMTAADVRERLEDMGYGPDSDLSRLRYALLPMLPALDTRPGADALCELIDGVQADWPEHHLVVIIDTMSRAVTGAEDAADTFRAFYSHTGVELKRRGTTWLRLDHAGKDPGQGQRGSSGKGDDVDVVWKLARTQNGLCLHRSAARMPWVAERVTFRMHDDPLRFSRLSCDWPEGTAEVANILSRLEVPLNATTRTAQAALRTIDEGRRRELVVAALRWRREQLVNL